MCFHSSVSPFLKTSEPILLCVLCAAHPHCTYNWECLDKPKLEFPSSPVVFIKDPLMYKCTVSIRGHSEESLHFDVTQDITSGIDVYF